MNSQRWPYCKKVMRYATNTETSSTNSNKNDLPSRNYKRGITKGFIIPGLIN